MGKDLTPTKLLIEAASHSGCQKSKRGVVIFPAAHHRIEFVAGWNHPAVGECDGSEACRRDCGKICIHAEQEALARAGSLAVGGELFHLKVIDGEPVPSGDPSCAECSKLMLRAGVAGVWLFQADGWHRWTAEEFHAATLKTLGLHRP